MEKELAREAAELYGLPPDRFTAARNARAKELRPDDAELAARVAKLAKPTAPAAAINQLARDEPSEVRALAQAGRALRAAQEAALGGRGAADDLPSASRDHRAALERVQREARRLGLSQPVLERVSATLRAASLDPELQPLLERGLLAHELQAAGFGLDPGLVAAAPPARARKQADSDAEKKRAQAKAALKSAKERLVEAKTTLADAESAHAEVAKKLERAEAEAAAAREAVADATEAVERAQTAASATSPSRRRSRSPRET
jgi:hypothetical protein